MKKIAGGSGAQKTFMLSFHCKVVQLDSDLFIGEMKESHWPRFDVIWVQSSSFMSSCTWCGVFSLMLVFSSETSCRIDGDSEVHPEGGKMSAVPPGHSVPPTHQPSVRSQVQTPVQHKIRNLKAALGGVLGVEGFQGQRRS